MSFAHGQENYIVNLNANFKEIYADNIESLLPKQFKIQKMLGKIELGEDALGSYYHQPLLLRNEQGVTYSVPGDGAATLKQSIPMELQDAKVLDAAISIRSVISYDALARANKRGKKAFQKATDLVVQSMVDTISKRVELSLIYGRSHTGIGAIAVAGDKIAGVSSAGVESTVIASSGTPTGNQVECATADSAHEIKIYLKVGQWAPGTWSGAVGTRVNVYLQTLTNNDTITIGTGIEANGFEVKKVNFVEKSVTLTTRFANGETVTAGNAADLLALIDAGTACHLKFLGAAGKEFIGLERICGNSGSLFDVDASVHDEWAGNLVDVAGNISATKMFQMVNVLLERGGEEEDFQVISSTRAWNVLMQEHLSKRVFDESYDPKKVVQGAMGVSFYHACGELKVTSSLYVKEGDIFILNLKSFKRLGTSDVQFGGRGSEEYVLHLTDQEGVEFRARTSQCLFCKRPKNNLFGTGITYASGT